jgi:aryl-alcohol dehydrogenase-like predicted oxidoreductase
MIGTTAIGWGNVNDKDSVAAIHAGLDKGINFFDTADIYGLGHSESLLGKTIGKDASILIASKVGNTSRNQQFSFDYSKDYILNACTASLKRLGRDTMDYYQLHTARVAHLQNGECIEAMQQLQQEGKIRYWGISLNTFDPAPEAEFFMQQSIGTGFQLVLNIINQKALSIIKEGHSKGYGIIARMPLQFGLLTGKFDGGYTFPENDHRKGRLNQTVIDAANKALAPVWQLCNKYECDKTTLALSYILQYKEISTVIPGIRTAEQINSNTVAKVILEKEDIALIEALGTTELVTLMELIKSQG